jgi:hypothetical protein
MDNARIRKLLVPAQPARSNYPGFFRMTSLWLWNVHPQRHMDRFVDGTIILTTTPPKARACAFDHLSSIVPIT